MKALIAISIMVGVVMVHFSAQMIYLGAQVKLDGCILTAAAFFRWTILNSTKWKFDLAIITELTSYANMSLILFKIKFQLGVP
jgi:hypothetical protein